MAPNGQQITKKGLWHNKTKLTVMLF